MKHGAVAILDILGFKGITKRENAAAVRDKLKRLQSMAEKIRAEGPASRPEVMYSHRVLLLSDTIVIGTSMEFIEGTPASELERATCEIIALGSTVTTAGALYGYAIDGGEPPFLLRGAIAAGPYDMEDRFMIGEAIDKAAEGEKVAKAAAIWLCPSAADVVEGYQARFDPGKDWVSSLGLIRDYDLPVEGGETIRAHIVDPFFEHEEVDVDAFVSRALSTFAPPTLDVLIKKRHTQVLFAAARARAASRKQTTPPGDKGQPGGADGH